MSKKKHILIICSRLDLPGGIERTIVNLGNLFYEKGNNVTLLVTDVTVESFYPVSAGVKIIQAPLTFGIEEKGNMISRKIKWLQDIRRLKKGMKDIRPHLIITTEYQFSIACVLARTKKTPPLISWEHHHFHWIKRNRFWEFLYKKLYPKLNLVVCQNRDEEPFYQAMGCRVTTIPYHLHLQPAFAANENSKEILSVGWLIHRKGTDLLMKAAKIVLEKHPDWKWRVIGDGELKNPLLEFIRQNGLAGKLILQKPVSHDITAYYQQASIFALTSRSESFGMVLAEAMCHGVPVVAFDCETGPRHVITNNQDGFLIEKENIQKLAEAINQLIEDPSLRKKMGENASKNIQRFSPDNIYKLWKEIL